MMNKETQKLMEEKNKANRCRACGRVLYGLIACDCEKRLVSDKLWNNPRRQDRVRLSKSKPSLDSDYKCLKE